MTATLNTWAGNTIACHSHCTGPSDWTYDACCNGPTCHVWAVCFWFGNRKQCERWAAVLLFTKLNRFWRLGSWFFLLIMKITNFRGGLTDISAKNEPLLSWRGVFLHPEKLRKHWINFRPCHGQLKTSSSQNCTQTTIFIFCLYEANTVPIAYFDPSQFCTCYTSILPGMI